jgi:hypothetical protein
MAEKTIFIRKILVFTVYKQHVTKPARMVNYNERHF